MDDDTELIAKRQVLVDAMHAMHVDQRIIIDLELAVALERAWDEYDAAVRSTPVRVVEQEVGK